MTEAVVGENRAWSSAVVTLPQVSLPPYARRLDVRATRAAFAAGTLGTVGDNTAGEHRERDVVLRDSNRYDPHGMESHDSTKDTLGRGGASFRDSGEGVPTGSLRDAPGKAALSTVVREDFTEAEAIRQSRLRRWQTIR